ncbi:MAG: hypothetical protein ACE5HU_08555 [Acidobacteriota bacterium]
MTIHPRRLFPVILAAFLLPVAPRAAEAPPDDGPRITITVSEATNLIHWVDNLAGTSIGKTKPIYRRYWQERFGPFDAEDRLALETFIRIRTLPLPTPFRIANVSGCLPIPADTLGWHQDFLIAAMRSTSITSFAQRLADRLTEEQRADLVKALERFQPRFERAWKDLKHVRRFRKRFERYFDRGDLRAYLRDMARFFGVDAAAAPAMKISLIGLPRDGPTHAEADGDHLLIEIRPQDSPRDQIQVVAHEAAHFLMRQMSAEQIDRLARQVFAKHPAGALVWRLLWESLPTSLGQGLAEARLDPSRFSLSQPWYHISQIDQFAKLIYPAVVDSMGRRQGVGDGLMARLTGLMSRSPLYRRAPTISFLMTAFYVSGEGLEQPLLRLRRRVGTGQAGDPMSFSLGEPEGADLLRRFECLGGVILVAPDELVRAARLGGSMVLSDAALIRTLAMVQRGDSVIATGRRPAGGTIFFLVAPRRSAAPRLVEAFTQMRGIPDAPLAVIEKNDKPLH